MNGYGGRGSSNSMSNGMGSSYNSSNQSSFNGLPSLLGAGPSKAGNHGGSNHMNNHRPGSSGMLNQGTSMNGNTSWPRH